MDTLRKNITNAPIEAAHRIALSSCLASASEYATQHQNNANARNTTIVERILTLNICTAL